MNTAKVEKEQFLWVDKYAPQTIDECILPKNIKMIFNGIVKKGNVPNMILSGSPGTGKTTIAILMCKLIGCDYKVINASDKRNIDLVRVDIENYASSRSFVSKKKRKVLILDEADGLNAQDGSAQDALRHQIEKFSDVCSFVMTANHVNKIIPALRSRLDVVDFLVPKEEKNLLIKELSQRLFEILKKESVDFDPKVVVSLVAQLFPDTRKTIGRLQIYANKNQNIDSGILSFVGNSKIEPLVDLLKSQNFTGVREWVVNNSDGDFESVQSGLFRQIDKIFLGDQAKVQFIVTSQKYQYQKSFSVDKEIHLLAYLIELMAGCKF